jgi:signal transduction histidine kinase
MKQIKIERVGSIRGLIETFILGAFVLLSLLAVMDQLPTNALSLTMMYVGAGCALWYTLRLRVPEGSFLHKVGFETLNLIALGLITIILLPLVTIPFGFWERVNVTVPAGFQLLSCLPAYVGFRTLLYGWLFWDRLRQRKLLWGLVHTQLSIVVIATTLVSVSAAIAITVDANRNFPEETIVATFAHRLILTIVPFFGVATIGLATALIVILPPSALASYLYSRCMIRRLESLAHTASELQQGNYAARVEVSGLDEVAQLQTDFNAMAADLENALAEIQAERDKVASLLDAQRQLTASVSHELRTPLATIQGYLEPALENPKTFNTETLAIIEQETQRLQRLIDDLFTLSQAEVDALKLQIQPIDVGAVAQSMIETHAPLAWQRGRIEVVAQTDGDQLIALADEGRLEQILTNLLRNGIRHTPPGGIVAVMVSQDEAWIQLEVRDTGEGIDPKELPLIWGRFYRGSEGRQNSKSGAGLGLALVKELTESMGGTVNVASTLGEGSVFTIRLQKSTN